MSAAQWYLAAEARHAHLPPGAERERLVERTFREIRSEAELVALRLPELDQKEQRALLDEAVLDTSDARGVPLTDLQEELFDLQVERTYERLCLRAREAKAEPRVKRALIERRLLRMPGIRSYLRLPAEHAGS